MSSGNVVDYATLAVSSVAVGLSSAVPAYTAGATVTGLLATFETDQVRMRTDGTDPTSTEGHLFGPGDALNLTDKNYSSLLPNLKFIRVTADAKVKITYFGL